MTTQDLFDAATVSYGNARKLVSKMGEIVSKAHPDFSVKMAYLKLDVIVQYTLLEIALADGQFLPIEGEFIDKITDTFDVINLFDNVPRGMNWKWFAQNKSFSDIKSVIGKLRSMAREHMNDFAKLFAVVDAAIPQYDILGELIGYLGEIAGCFTRIDGSIDSREADIGATVTTEYLVKPWVEMRKSCR